MKINFLRPEVVKSFNPWTDPVEFVLLLTEPATSTKAGENKTTHAHAHVHTHMHTLQEFLPEEHSFSSPISHRSSWASWASGLDGQTDITL